MHDDVTQLVRRCREGDELAWEELVRRFQGRVLGLVTHYVRSREDARDVAQEVFIRVHRSLPNFEQEDRFVPWLLRVTRTCAIDHTRRRAARPPAQDVPVENVLALADPAPDPAEHAERRSDRGLVRRALERCSELHREILVLRDIQGMALQDVAELLGIPGGTAKSRAARARAELARAVLALEDEEARSMGEEGAR
ncbi:MAG TPA: sigma-70 family RNA polymerase sigma factor [Candidatus Krumholzibacteria bacterium]|nr:sigma-70 family RNA polymerase sigma factor [Candidatus Krumholzibacteria bacterium]